MNRSTLILVTTAVFLLCSRQDAQEISIADSEEAWANKIMGSWRLDFDIGRGTFGTGLHLLPLKPAMFPPTSSMGQEFERFID